MCTMMLFHKPNKIQHFDSFDSIPLSAIHHRANWGLGCHVKDLLLLLLGLLIAITVL